jgi:hypothetical protein
MSGPGPVLLHVGTPKTGTSYLQSVLFANREALAAQGLLYPADRFDAHFLAALDLMRLPWGGLEEQARGAWDDLAAQVRAWPGTVIISHEILAAATREDAERALFSLGYPDREVRIIVSVRDLARQIPAEWQENVKHRRTLSYGRFLDQVRDPEHSGQVGSWFWSVQAVPEILDRWAGGMDPSAITLVTVPPSGSPRGLLWERLTEAFGIGGYRLTLEDERANPSMGVPETALVRQINKTANAVVAPDDYRVLVRELLAHQALALRSGTPRLAVPPDVWSWADQTARAWVADLRARGYQVIGDLDELIPAPAAGEYADPDQPAPEQVVDAAVEAIRVLLVEGARQRDVEAQLRRELHESRDEVHRTKSARLRAKEKVYRYAKERPLGQRALGTYQRLRRR